MDRDESFATAQEEEKALGDYGVSPAAIVMDCSIDLPITCREFLLGQRAISALQIAREGKNVEVVHHIRQDVEHSYKELYVDITGKLPSFARAVLPQLLLYMENAVDFPRNTASVVCLKPKSLKGACAFSETLLTEINEKPKFSINIPSKTGLPYEHRKIDHNHNWKLAEKPRAMPKCTIHKRFLLDVGCDSFFFRSLRGFIIRKFIDAFIDMVREVELCVRAWNRGEPRFDEKQCCQGGIAPGPQFWPTEGVAIKDEIDKVLAELKKKSHPSTSVSVPSPDINQLGKRQSSSSKQPRRRTRTSSSFFVGVE